MTAGRVLQGDEDGRVVFTEQRTPKLGSAAAIDWLLALVVLLIPLEAAVRKLQLDVAAMMRFWRGARAAEPDATMKALLQRKGEVATGRARQAAAPAVGTGAAARAPAADEVTVSEDDDAVTPPPVSTEREAGAADKAIGDEDAPSSTTGRLLRMKQRRSQEKPDRGPQGDG